MSWKSKLKTGAKIAVNPVGYAAGKVGGALGIPGAQALADPIGYAAGKAIDKGPAGIVNQAKGWASGAANLVKDAFSPTAVNPNQYMNQDPRQAAYLNALQAQARGDGPSQAQNQYAMALQQAANQRQSAVAGARGADRGAMRLQGIQQEGDANAMGAQQSAALRAQEMQQAQQMYGQQLNAQHGQQMDAYKLAQDEARRRDQYKAAMLAAGAGMAGEAFKWGTR